MADGSESRRGRTGRSAFSQSRLVSNEYHFQVRGTAGARAA
ncbi:hypothetical protein [Paenibacillus sp. yr247]|nr:hypothetical protein [Paenibacillus sp. yr247]